MNNAANIIAADLATLAITLRAQNDHASITRALAERLVFSAGAGNWGAVERRARHMATVEADHVDAHLLVATAARWALKTKGNV